MLTRFSGEIAGRRIRRNFAVLYFIAMFALFLAYGAGIVLLNARGTGLEASGMFDRAVKALYVLLNAAVVLLAFARIRRWAARSEDRETLPAAALFVRLILAAWLVRLILFVLSGIAAEFLALFIFVYFAGNIPPLLVWRSHSAGNNSISDTASRMNGKDLDLFSRTYIISKREEDVVRLVLEGRTNREIGEALFISLQTVKDHLYRVLQKTGVRNRVQLINLIRGGRRGQE